MTDEQIMQEMQAADAIRANMAERAEAREVSSEQYYQWMSDTALNSPAFGRDVEAYLPEHSDPAIGIEPPSIEAPEPEQDTGIGY